MKVQHRDERRGRMYVPPRVHLVKLPSFTFNDEVFSHMIWQKETTSSKKRALIYCHQGQSQKTAFLLCLIKSITTITSSCFFQSLSITTIISITSINQSNQPITLNCSVLKNQSRLITLLIKQNTIKHYWLLNCPSCFFQTESNSISRCELFFQTQ